MRVYQIKFNSIEEVKKFVNIAGKYGYEIELERDGHTVDAKSIMGVLSLGFEKPLNLIASTENALSLKKEIEDYLL